jgi:uncharacterized protein (UPF0210 family)
MKPTVRSICLFSNTASPEAPRKLAEIEKALLSSGCTVQTKRYLAPVEMHKLQRTVNDAELYLSVGSLSLKQATRQLREFCAVERMSCNIDLTDEVPNEAHVDFLHQLIRNAPGKTFYFAYSFSNVPSSPFFPASAFAHAGFSVGLQPTDLAEGCQTLDEWLSRIKEAWYIIADAVGGMTGFLGIDSSVAPLGDGRGSLVAFARNFYSGFQRSLISDHYVKISKFIRSENSWDVGLCGLMFPCLEDFELATEYEQGHFSLATNIYLSLHSGLGIDTYPIGIDEDPRTVLDVLRLMRALAAKYSKPLSVRFVSDGKSRIGERTNFNNEYLKDVVIRPLSP